VTLNIFNSFYLLLLPPYTFAFRRIYQENENLILHLKWVASVLFYFVCLQIILKPGPASTVQELRTTEREDPGSTPDEGS
jgi:hypothetical protein